MTERQTSSAKILHFARVLQSADGLGRLIDYHWHQNPDGISNCCPTCHTPLGQWWYLRNWAYTFFASWPDILRSQPPSSGNQIWSIAIRRCSSCPYIQATWRIVPPE